MELIDGKYTAGEITPPVQTDVSLEISDVLKQLRESIIAKDARVKELEKYEAMLYDIHTELTALTLIGLQDA
jgi:hypothetical protein